MDTDQPPTIVEQLAAALEREQQRQAELAGTADSPSAPASSEPNTGS